MVKKTEIMRKPNTHECAKIAVTTVVTQEHLGGGQGGPLRDGVHLDGLRLLVGQLGGVELVPRDVGIHVPAYGFELFEEFRVKHQCSPGN